MFLLATCLAAAALPETEAVQNAYTEASGTIEAEPEITAKAYFAIVLAAEPTAANRTKLVDAVVDTLNNDFSELGISDEVEETCFFHFWRTAAARFPEEERFQTTALAYESKRLPWERLQPRLLARGDASALGLGLDRLVKAPEPKSTTAPFAAAAATHMAKATPEEINKFLWFGDKEGFSEIVVAAQKRLLLDKDPEIQKLAATPAVRQILLRSEVRKIAVQYDLTTLKPPTLPPLTVQGPGQSEKAFEQLKQTAESLPRIKEDGPRFRETIAAFDALIAAYPNYERIYEMKADRLFYAGLTEEALLTQITVARMSPNRALDSYDSGLARYWMALGYRGQALIEAHRTLKGSISGYDADTLLIFCAVAVPESLKDDGLVPESWTAMITERLGKLEEQGEAVMRNSSALHLDAIRFWEKSGDFPRARAALARFKKDGRRELVKANEGSFADWEKRWEDASTLALFYGLPEAPKPYGMDLEQAFHEGDLAGAWALYSKWAEAEPKAVAARLYGAAAFADLGAPYLALALIEEGKGLGPTALEAQLLARVKAVCSARLGEPVAAALAYAESGDVESLSTYWLQVFVEANQAAAYSRISNRALEVLSADKRDSALLPWAWKTYAMTAPASAVDTWRDTLTAGGGLPESPAVLAPSLTQGVAKTQGRLQVAWSDGQVVQGEVSNRDWFLFAQLAAADGREADAAFFAACWLLGLSPNETYEAAAEAQARALVTAYRDGAAAEGDLAEALRRNPCDVAVMVKGYEAARAKNDMYEAAAYLRRLWMAYGEDRIDLLVACNVATAAADWELLLTVSQTAVARQPSDESRGWYNLALVACDKGDTAETIRNQMYDGTLRTVAREIDGWVPFVDGYGNYLRVLSAGEYAELHGAIKDASELREARPKAEKEPAGYRHYQDLVSKLAAAVSKRLVGASPSFHSHVAFQSGEIDEAKYKASMTSPDDQTFAQIFSILRRWKVGNQVKLEGDDLADVQSIMYDQGRHLRFRVMAYAMLRKAEVIAAPRPVRASDPLFLEKPNMGALAEMRAGRLTLINGAHQLTLFLGGSMRVSAPNHKTVRAIALPTPPAVMRLRIVPDSPEQRLSGLTSANYEQRMVEFAKVGLRPALERAFTTLQSELAAAGSAPEQRWDAFKRAAPRFRRIGEDFFLERSAVADELMAILLPHLNKYPVDAYSVVADTQLIPLDYMNRLNTRAQEVVKLGQQANRNASNQHKRETGDQRADYNSQGEAEKLLLSFPPGSENFPLVREMLAEGIAPGKVAANVAAEKSRRRDAIAAAKRREENLKLFDAAMAKGDMAGVEKAALELGGQHYVQWALKAPNIRLDQLAQARAYATNWNDSGKLAAAMTKLVNAQWKAERDAQYRSSAPARRSSDSSSAAWRSFTSDMSKRYDASVQYQKARDSKNFIVRTRSDGSYSTHQKY